MSRAPVIFDDHGKVLDCKHRPRDQRLWKAIALAPSVEVCEALLRGESVPVSRLDPEAVRRLGRRPR